MFDVNKVLKKLEILGFDNNLSPYIIIDKLLIENITDHLTKLYNRRYFDIRIDEEKHRLNRVDNYKLSIAYIDIDNFKTLNDNYGHSSGDIVLKNIAAIIKNNCRKSDIPFRIGGDEFAIIFSGYNDLGTYRLVERLRKRIAKKFKSKNITVSIGVYNYRQEGIFTLDKVDAALYDAKEYKNKTIIL